MTAVDLNGLPYIAISIARAATAAFATVSTVALGPIFAVTAAVAGAVAVVAAMATAFSSDAVPSVKELTEATRDMREAMDAAKSAYSDTVNSTMAAAGVADTYIDKLEDLQAAGLESEDAQRQYPRQCGSCPHRPLQLWPPEALAENSPSPLLRRHSREQCPKRRP